MSPATAVAVAPVAAQYIPPATQYSPPSGGSSPDSSYDEGYDEGYDAETGGGGGYDDEGGGAEPYGSEGDEQIYDSGPVGPPVENDFTLEPDDSYLPEVEGEEMAEENDPYDIADLDYAAVFAGLEDADDSAANYGLGDWKADLKKVGSSVAVGAAKGAASTGLTLIANKLAQSAPAGGYIPPPPTGLSMPAKIAIGVGLGVPVLYLLTQRGRQGA